MVSYMRGTPPTNLNKCKTAYGVSLIYVVRHSTVNYEKNIMVSAKHGR